MFANTQRQHLPPGTLVFGMALFLATLTMLFAASMLGYTLIRLNNTDVLPIGHMRPPFLLWVSTALILASSVTIHMAVDAVANEKQQRFRRAIMATFLLSIGFIVIQTPALTEMLHTHQQMMLQNTYLYGLAFFLILVHALHVIGGLIPMVIITAKAHRGGYDHESYAPVKCLGYYWHFLDAVWFVMFCLFMAMG